MTRKLRWGILSTAKIGREKVIPALQGAALCEVAAIASRTPGRAQPVAAALGIPRAHDSYEALLADPEIEAIYNPLPNDQHVEWTLRAAAAGKHVLCEKPLAMDARQATELRDAARRVQIAEAFMVRHHPQWQRVRARVRAGDLGPVRALQSWFSYFNVDAANIRNRPEHGGGALYDIGCYAIVTARHVFEAEPLRVVSMIDRDPRFGTDRLVSALVDFGQGRRLDFSVSTQTVPWQRVQVVGERARLEVRIPFNAPLGGPTDLLFDDGSALDGSRIQVETVPACNMYGLQGDAFVRAVRGEQPLEWGIEDAIANMRVIDAVFASERSGGWVAV